jgi:hypothetical protein
MPVYHVFGVIFALTLPQALDIHVKRKRSRGQVTEIIEPT